MSNPGHSSFDRGFDDEPLEPPRVTTPVIGRQIGAQVRGSRSWRKIAAYAMVAIMVVSAVAVMLPQMTGPATNPDDGSNPVKTEIGGARQVTYTISNLFESNMKVSDNTSLGAHTGSQGINQWWDQRQAGGVYGDWVVRNTYPFVISYPPYGYAAVTGAAPQMPWGTYSFYKLNVNAQNITTIQTGPNEDPIMIPILGQTSRDGGWVNINWHLTYMTNDDCLLLDAGTHYSNTYYGVPVKGGGNGPPQGFGGYYSNDGWFFEISGKMTFDRNAAAKFLGLTGAGDLRPQFDTANAGWALSNAWRSDWWTEASLGGAYDPYAAYQYSIDALTVYLTRDPASTADSLVLRIFSDSWGMEMVVERWLDVAGITSNINYIYPEDMYFNATLSPDGSDISMIGVNAYHTYTWKDPQVGGAAWMIEAMHSDYINDTRTGHTWTPHFIPYNPVRYGPKTGYYPSKLNWMPGTSTYGVQTSYWYTPTNWNLAADETIVIKLGNSRAWGVMPYGDYDGDDALGAAKAAELLSHGVWGELVLGHTTPSSLYSATYYDSATKTLTLDGPLTIAKNQNPLFPKLNETGTPLIPLAVSPVSKYTVEMVEAGPYQPGVTYNVRVTCLNFTDAAVSGYFHNISLATNNAGSVFGSSSHAFGPADSNVWTTTVIFGELRASTTITVTSGEFPLDITDTLTITVVPEFPTLLIPVIGIAAAVVVVVRRRKQ